MPLDGDGLDAAPPNKSEERPEGAPVSSPSPCARAARGGMRSYNQ